MRSDADLDQVLVAESLKDDSMECQIIIAVHIEEDLQSANKVCRVTQSTALW